MTEEIWKDVVGYEGYYQVSNFGNVRSLDRTIVGIDGVKKYLSGRAMTIWNNSLGYAIVRLSKDGKAVSRGVHMLVAQAFLQIPDDGEYVVNHIDCNPANNRLDNLEYVTQAGNIHHAFRMGNHRGARNYLLLGQEESKDQILHDMEVKQSVESLLSHKGGDNGRARRIQCEIDGEMMIFPYSGDCALYLAENYMTYATHLLSIQQGVRRSAREHIPYWGIQFEYID